MAFCQQRLKILSITAKNDTSIYCNKNTYYNYKYVYYIIKYANRKKNSQKSRKNLEHE